jgi:hypothetical protein
MIPASAIAERHEADQKARHRSAGSLSFRIIPRMLPRRPMPLEGPLGLQLGLFDTRRGRPRTAEKYQGIHIDNTGRTRVADGVYLSLCGNDGVVAIEIAKTSPKIDRLKPVAIGKGFREGELVLVNMVHGRNAALDLVSVVLKEADLVLIKPERK